MTKKWKAAGALAAAAIATLALSACGSDGDSKSTASDDTKTNSTVAVPTFAAGSTMERLQKAGKINIGTKYDQPGFGQINPATNKPEGFDVDIATLVAQGIYGGSKADAAGHINWLEAKSKDREPFIQQGKVDLVVATYTINDTRKQVVDFAGPYYTAHGDILVKSTNTDIKSVTDLNGKTVCVVQGSTYPKTIAEKAPQATQMALADYSSCEQAVKDNRAAAMATDNVILLGLVSKSNNTEKILNANYTDEPYGIGLKLDDKDFLKFVNDRLQTIYDNGEWKSAFQSELGKLGAEVPSTPPTINRYKN
jgi:glutamate transport system substrate-binding protein